MLQLASLFTRFVARFLVVVMIVVMQFSFEVLLFQPAFLAAASNVFEYHFLTACMPLS